MTIVAHGRGMTLQLLSLLLLLSSAAAFHISPLTPSAALTLRSECAARLSCLRRTAPLHAKTSLSMSGSPQTPPQKGNFFKNLAQRQGLSMGGCALGLAFGIFLAYQVLNFVVWLLAKILGFGVVMVCSKYPMGFCYWVVPNWVKPAAALFLLVTGVAPLLASIPSAISGAQCPVYTIENPQLGGVAGIELRRYEAFPVAVMETSGTSARQRMQAAFGRLTGYVTSMNKDPATGRKVNLGISGFLMLRKDGPGQPFRAALALPQKETRTVYPTPLDEAISVGTMPEEVYAGTTLDGGLPEDVVLEELVDAVQDAAEAEGLRLKASVVICQVMGEFKTEVLIPLASHHDVSAMPPPPGATRESATLQSVIDVTATPASSFTDVTPAPSSSTDVTPAASSSSSAPDASDGAGRRSETASPSAAPPKDNKQEPSPP